MPDMNSDLAAFYRRLRFLQEWINLSIDNRIQRQVFEDLLLGCGINPDRFPQVTCIYDDFEGYCASREDSLKRFFMGSGPVTFQASRTLESPEWGQFICK